MALDAAPESGATISPLSSTASRLEPSTKPSWCSVVSFQRESGAPLRNHDDPLSASSAPYFLSAFRITWTSAGYGVISNEAFSRKRVPIGGYWVPLRAEAGCRAGQTYELPVWGAVMRMA